MPYRPMVCVKCAAVQDRWHNASQCLFCRGPLRPKLPQTGLSMDVPMLRPIDLTKTVRTSTHCTHPDIQLDAWYLAYVRGIWHVGHFGEQWYGLVLNCSWAVQLEPPRPGGWERLYEIMS